MKKGIARFYFAFYTMRRHSFYIKYYTVLNKELTKKATRFQIASFKILFSN